MNCDGRDVAMTDAPTNVISIGGAPICNDRKAAFLDAVATSFDAYIKDFGAEPDAIVYVLGGIKQTARPGWSMYGESMDGATSMKAFAAMALMRE